MNIFVLDRNPFRSAEMMVDSHVVKMILESAQLLSTAHRVLDGVQYTEKSPKGRSIKRWRLPDGREQVLYSATHIGHPCAVWARQCVGNYNWLLFHFLSLMDEYTRRYNRRHKCEALKYKLMIFPDNLSEGKRTDFVCAMDEQYIISDDPVENYRNYYKHGKAHLHKWTNRKPPRWIND